MKKLLLLAMAVLAMTACLTTTPLKSQEPVTVAIFPFKNLYGEVKYDSLSWSFADSLYAYLTSLPGHGTTYTLLPMDDLRDQMIALNIDVKSPSYETDVWKVVRALGARIIVWGTYLVKYEKANIEVKVINARTIMPDPVYFAEKIRVPYPLALSTVVVVGDKI